MTFTWKCVAVGADVGRVGVGWVEHQRAELVWGLDEAMCPEGLVSRMGRMGAVGLDRRHWKTTAPINKIFREAFEGAGITYYNPHSFRRTLGRLAGEFDLTAEQQKAWSQNYGHDNLATTISYYMHVPFTRQAEIMRGLASGNRGESA